MTDIEKLIEDLGYARYHCTSTKGKKSIDNAIDFIETLQANNERLHSMNKSKLDTIHDLQAEIENYSHNVRGLTKSIRKYQKLYDEVQSENKRLKVNNKAIMQTMADVHTEAIKEFAERLKEYLKGNGGLYCVTTMNAQIDNLVKEMVGEE